MNAAFHILLLLFPTILFPGIRLCEDSSFVLRESSDSNIVFMFWNLENFFDYMDDGNNSSDREFSSFGKRRWTKKRFYDKCNAVAKAVLWTGDRFGKLPDAIGFAEVENSFVLYSLCNSTLLRKSDYKVVHFDSPDPRGIDVALIYRESVFRKARSVPIHIRDSSGNIMNTRDILLSTLVIKDSGDTVHLLVNHHPSKFSGAKTSEGRRTAAVETLAHICDSLESKSSGMIVAMGDFNDTPDASSFASLDRRLTNLAYELHSQGKGSIRFSGKWDLIDMFFVSGGFSDRYKMDVLAIPFLMTRDTSYPGDKPLRTYSGPRYLGGVSDHLPVVLYGKDYFILE